MPSPRSRGRMPDGSPNPVDVHVGSRIRLRRELLSLSQEKLAALLGITFQQVQKYEQGSNRISASRLWDLSRILEVPITFFFADMDAVTDNHSPRRLYVPDDLRLPWEERPPEKQGDPLWSREHLEFLIAFQKISNRRLANSLRNAVLAAARTAKEEEIKAKSSI